MKIKGSSVTGIQCDVCKRALPEEYTSKWHKGEEGDYCSQCFSKREPKQEINKFNIKEVGSPKIIGNVSMLGRSDLLNINFVIRE